MKLRNKKTGEIVDTLCPDDITKGLAFGIDKHDGNPTMSYYNSLAELNADWEDYEPKEPLIKDEKVRKAVRAWAEALGVTKVYVCGIGDGKEYIELYAQDNGVTDGRIRISIPTQDGVWIGKEYTVAELCGEEDE